MKMALLLNSRDFKNLDKETNKNARLNIPVIHNIDTTVIPENFTKYPRRIKYGLENGCDASDKRIG